MTPDKAKSLANDLECTIATLKAIQTNWRQRIQIAITVITPKPNRK